MIERRKGKQEGNEREKKHNKIENKGGGGEGRKKDGENDKCGECTVDGGNLDEG